MIKIRELRGGLSDTTDRATPEVADKYHVYDGDVLFSWSGTLTVKVWTEGHAVLNQHLFKVTSETAPRWFYYGWVLHHLGQFQRIAADKATTMGHIKRRHLTDAKVAVPPPDEMEAAGRELSPLLERQIANDLQDRTLASLRDRLIPALLSGAVRVDDEPADAAS